METISMLILGALVSGFVVGLGTQFLLGREKAHKYPGGSFSVGVMAGISLQQGFAPIVLGAVFGVIGWIVYRRFFPLE